MNNYNFDFCVLSSGVFYVSTCPFDSLSDPDSLTEQLASPSKSLTLLSIDDDDVEGENYNNGDEPPKSDCTFWYHDDEGVLTIVINDSCDRNNGIILEMY